MGRFKVELVAEYEECCGRPFSLPNGVAVFDSGAIAVADGANNRICVLNETGNGLACTGQEGFGRYRFKEPVGVFVSPRQRAYVADWHNHRVVVFDEDLNYIGEFGKYGKVTTADGRVPSPLWKILTFLDGLAAKGTYIDRHFLEGAPGTATKRRRSIKLFAQGLSYWVRRSGSLAAAARRVLSAEDTLEKPNGVAFLPDDLIVVTQKNGRCISVYREDEEAARFYHVQNVFEPATDIRFGRLGNVLLAKDGFVYVCDEWQHCIWKLDTALEFIEKITLGLNSGTGEFLPFSCASLTEELLVVCGGLNFQILDLKAKAVVFCSETLGELHGVAYDDRRRRLYVADRSEGVIRAYETTAVGE